MFTKHPETKSEELSNELFCKKLIIELNKDNDLRFAITKIIQSDY